MKSNAANVRGDYEAQTVTSSCMELSEVNNFAHFDNETAIAAVEEVSDGEQKQEIESVMEMIRNADAKFPLREHERCSYKIRKGSRKRHASHEWQNFYGGSVNYGNANVVNRRPKKRLFAHR